MPRRASAHSFNLVLECESDRKINADGENEPVSRVYVQRENVERVIMGYIWFSLLWLH